MLWSQVLAGAQPSASSCRQCGSGVLPAVPGAGSLQTPPLCPSPAGWSPGPSGKRLTRNKAFLHFVHQASTEGSACKGAEARGELEASQEVSVLWQNAWTRGGEGRELLPCFPWAPCHVQAGRALPCQCWWCPCQQGGAHRTLCPGTGLLPCPRAGTAVGHCQVPSTPRAGWHNRGLAFQSSDPLCYLNKRLLPQQGPSARPHHILSTGYGQDLAPEGAGSSVILPAGDFLVGYLCFIWGT